MAKVNEEIVGGLISALSRKETLEKAMMTFYNAGYEKEEIEDSAKDVYNKLGSKAMGINGSLQEALDDIANKAGVTKKEKPKEEESSEEVSQNSDLNLKPIPEKKPETKPETITDSSIKEDISSNKQVSIYGSDDSPSNYQNPDELTKKIEEAIKGLRPVNIPSKIEIVNRSEFSKSPTVVQHVSGYAEPQIKPASKAVTYMLIFILIILLGALVAVFLFKDELIQLFNELGLG